MVGNSHRSPPGPTSTPRCSRSASTRLPGVESCARAAAGRARLPGRRSRARPAAGPEARRPRRRGRGGCRAARRRAGRRDDRARALRHGNRRLGDLEIDIARARAETYARPGPCRTVEPATIAEDLARRDFTVNAMAVALEGEAQLIDPYGGVEDLRAGVLRVLHARIVQRRPDPSAPGGPLLGAPRPGARSGHRAPASRGGPRDGVERPRRRRARAHRRRAEAERGARAGPRVGPDRPRQWPEARRSHRAALRGPARVGGVRGPRRRDPARGGARRPSRPAARPRWEGRPPRRPGSPAEIQVLAHDHSPRCSRWPAPPARPGSTCTSIACATSSSRSRLRPDRGGRTRGPSGGGRAERGTRGEARRIGLEP